MRRIASPVCKRFFASFFLLSPSWFGESPSAGRDPTASLAASDTVTAEPAVSSTERRSIEFLPLLSYDTDVGFGFGVKTFFLNQLGWHESFDLAAFHSTGGERWYRFVAASPDFELRQGKPYPLSVELVIDYDKYLKNSFFGIGNKSRYEDRERYTREPLEISLSAGRGWTAELKSYAALRYRQIRNFNFADQSRLYHLPPSSNASTVRTVSIIVGGLYDRRDSYVNPSMGMVASVEAEFASSGSLGSAGFTRVAAGLQGYSRPAGSRTTVAWRLNASMIDREDLPVQLLLPLGGNQTLRGSPQDRFLDRVVVVANIEGRFPLVWRLGGIAGIDAGKVWHRLGALDLSRWSYNAVAGLRLYMNTFVVRLDVGVGLETTGLYLNFGQLF